MNDYRWILLLAFIVLFDGTLIWFSNVGWHLYRDRNLHLWPSVTRCRICDKRIWAWQRHERRENGVNVSGNGAGYAYVTSSSLYHCKCKGTVPSEITVTVK